jgi:predicted dehydrogenase
LEDEGIWGTLTTTEQFDPCQQYDEESKLYVGKYPSKVGYYRGYYENVVDAIRGKAEVNVKPEEAAAGLLIMEMARESSDTGRTIDFAEAR